MEHDLLFLAGKKLSAFGLVIFWTLTKFADRRVSQMWTIEPHFMAGYIDTKVGN